MPEIVASKLVFEGWATLRIATVRGADGRTFERLIEDHGSAACVLAYDPQRKVALLVRQFRAPVSALDGKSDLLEAIAGLTDGEPPAAAAAREAFEEAGLRLRALETIGTLWTMPGISAERMSLHLASYAAADREGPGGGQAGENEDILVVELPLRQLAEMADNGLLEDLKTFALVQTLRLRQPELFS